MIYPMTDEKFMRITLKLAAKAQGLTSPNPMVGALIVRNGEIISQGFHRKAGALHAEAEAIEHAGESVEGSTLYVNLEPCCHTDKRTPPCTNAIIASKTARVVVAMMDPNPKVSGMGIKMLRDAGIDVSVGILEHEAKKLNEFYIKFITTGTPFVILKTAMTLDGKIATPEGKSKWISSEKSRKLVHRMRGQVDAVLSAIGTIEADNPQFTTRIKGLKDPIRVIIDPQLRVPDGYHVLETPPKTYFVTKKETSRTRELEKKGIGIIRYADKLHLKNLMVTLGKMDITSVMIEGGSRLASHALDDSIVDKIMYFIAPKIIGGQKCYPAVGGDSFREIENAIAVKDITVKRIGEDILVEGYLHR
jgi:diaminohydroxyphosphoribosylaminopyrimidine deaminase/5-amino-6-(5-phosphoribosylamino)uracil reductase